MELIKKTSVAYSSNKDEGNTSCHETFLFLCDKTEKEQRKFVIDSVTGKTMGFCATSTGDINVIFNKSASKWYRCVVSKIDKWGDFCTGVVLTVLVQSDNEDDAIKILKEQIKEPHPDCGIEYIKEVVVHIINK